MISGERYDAVVVAVAAVKTMKTMEKTMLKSDDDGGAVAAAAAVHGFPHPV